MTRALEPGVHQEGRDRLTVWLGASHLSLGLSFPSKPLFPRARPPLTCLDQRQGRGLLFRLPFLIQSEEKRPIPEPHTALEHSPSPPGSGPPHRPHTMGGRRPGEELSIWNWKELWKCAIHILFIIILSNGDDFHMTWTTLKFIIQRHLIHLPRAASASV